MFWQQPAWTRPTTNGKKKMRKFWNSVSFLISCLGILSETNDGAVWRRFRITRLYQLFVQTYHVTVPCTKHSTNVQMFTVWFGRMSARQSFYVLNLMQTRGKCERLVRITSFIILECTKAPKLLEMVVHFSRTRSMKTLFKEVANYHISRKLCNKARDFKLFFQLLEPFPIPFCITAV